MQAPECLWSFYSTLACAALRVKCAAGWVSAFSADGRQILRPLDDFAEAILAGSDSDAAE